MTTEPSRPPPATLVEQLYRRADRAPDALAYTFLGDGESVTGELTFGELRDAARCLAARLRGLGHGSRALLLFADDLDFLVACFGCWCAGIVPVPVSLPRQKKGYAVLASITENAGAACILSTRALLDRHEQALSENEVLRGVARFATDASSVDDPEPTSSEWALPAAEALALLQYTSGSTGEPKGVALTHANLAHNAGVFSSSFQLGSSDVIVSWLPLFHDLGIGTALQAPWLGVHCVLLPPAAFVAKPVRWLRAISRYRATYSGAPDFAYDLCARRVLPAQKEGLDLSSWRSALNGSEPVRPRTIERFNLAFSDLGFRPGAMRPAYGLAEGTLIATVEDPAVTPLVRSYDKARLGSDVAAPSSDEDSVLLASSGVAGQGVQLLVVDPDTHLPCPERGVGEIWIAGPSVATGGYWRRLAATVETFHATTLAGEGPFLRTGDLGFLDNGHVFVTGRLKDVIIVRGRNHYPQDVEATVSDCHAMLEPNRAAVFAVDDGEREQLVVVQEVRRAALRSPAGAEAVAAIRAAVSAEHGLDVHAVVLIRPASLPRTSSGKVQRKACQRAFLEGTFPALFSWVAPSRTEPDGAIADRERAALGWLRSAFARQLEQSPRPARPRAVDVLARRGLLALEVPMCEGGLGLDLRASLGIVQQIGAIDLTLGALVSAHAMLGAYPVWRHGSARQRAALLPSIASGAALASLGTGTTHAARWGGEEAQTVLSGDLEFQELGVPLSWVHFPTEGGGASLRTLFLDDTLLVERQTREGTPDLTQCRLHLAGSRALQHHALGADGRGLAIQDEALSRFRLATGALVLGALKRVVGLSVVQASATEGRSLLSQPTTLARIGPLTAGLMALESLIDGLATALDAGYAVSPSGSRVVAIVSHRLLAQAVRDLGDLSNHEQVRDSLSPAVQRLAEHAELVRRLRGMDDAIVATRSLGEQALHDASWLRTLLSDVLSAPHVASTLRDGLSALRRPPVQGSRRAREVGNKTADEYAGELAVWSVVRAALEGGTPRFSATDRARAAAWAIGQFERALCAIIGGTPSEGVVLSPAAVQEAVAGYPRAVGRLDERAGRDAAAGRELGAAETRDDLRAWVLDWLSTRLDAPGGGIDPARSFADHGIDSVTAVELAQSLSEKLHRRLDETLLWEFSTIGDLIDHLVVQPYSEPPPLRSDSFVRRTGESETVPAETELDDELARLELELERGS